MQNTSSDNRLQVTIEKRVFTRRVVILEPGEELQTDADEHVMGLEWEHPLPAPLTANQILNPSLAKP